MLKFYFIFSEKFHGQEPNMIKILFKDCARAKQPADAEAFMVCGGDGTMLKAVNEHGDLSKPFCGLNFGHTGFLMNTPKAEVVKEILSGRFKRIKSHLLEGELYNTVGTLIGKEFAFNDMYFERLTKDTARIQISVDGQQYFNPLVCDGALVSTPAGSTAYNASAHGRIVPLKSASLVLTGICPAIFHRWHTSILDSRSVIELRPINTIYRRVRFLADNREIPNVARAMIRRSKESVTLLFARSENYEKKVLDLQMGRNLI